jgi:GNAT superfamily N-acetyltransferase
MSELWKASYQKKLESLIDKYQIELSKRFSEEFKIFFYNKGNDYAFDIIDDIHKRNSIKGLGIKEYSMILLKSSKPSIFVVEGKKPAAYVINEEEINKGVFNESYYTEKIIVSQDYQKKGIGPMLLNLSCAVAKGLKLKYQSLVCNEKNNLNVNLVKFYTNLGYQNLFSNNNNEEKSIHYFKRNVNKYSPI